MNPPIAKRKTAASRSGWNALFILLPLLISFVAAPDINARPHRSMNQCEFFLSRADNRTFAKSGTPRLYQMLRERNAKVVDFQSAYSTFGRPQLDRFADSARGRFRVHYDISGIHAPNLEDLGGNGIPDYVDSLLVYLEYAWDVTIELGYGRPKSDMGRGGSDAVDVYLQELSPQQYYGYTSPDTFTSGIASAYMVLDNDFKESVYPTKGLDAAKVTSIHEFFHVIHYSYYGGEDAVWWMEHTAVWIENYAWKDIKDYLNYTSDFLSNRNVSIDSNSSYMYSAALFAFMIAKKHGPDTIRAVWNEFRDRQSGKIQLLNPILPGGLAQALGDLGVWSYFTGNRANPSLFFNDSALMRTEVIPEKTLFAIPATDSLTLRRYTFKYIELQPPNGLAQGDSLRFEFAERNGGVWKKQVILYNSPDDFELREIAGSQLLIPIPRFFRKATLVLANASPGAGDYRLVYSVYGGAPTPPVPTAFSIDQNYPNPFNRETMIRYTVPEQAHVRIRVMNLQGQTVKTLVDGIRSKGSHGEPFQPTDISSGIYVILLESGNTYLTRKITFMK